jgi:hypothetical protein
MLFEYTSESTTVSPVYLQVETNGATINSNQVGFVKSSLTVLGEFCADQPTVTTGILNLHYLIGDSVTTDLKLIFTLNNQYPVCAGYEYYKSTSSTLATTVFSDSRVTVDQTAQSLTVTSSSYTASAITFYTYMKSTASYLLSKKQMELNIYKCSPVNAEVVYKF